SAWWANLWRRGFARLPRLSHRRAGPGVANSRAGRPLIHVALVTLFVLQFLDVVVGRRHIFAALFLDDLAQRRIDILGHPARVAADKKLRAFAVDPFPNLARVLQHEVLDIDLVSLIARPGAIESGENAIALEASPILFVGV